MKRKNFMLTVAAAAVLGAFNPVFAGGGAKHGSADDVSSSPRAEQGQPGTQSGLAVESAKMNPGASADASSPPRAEQGQPGTQSGPAVESADAGLSADQSAASGTTARQSSRGNVQFGHSDIQLGGIGPQASAERSQDVDPQTGLDRSHSAN